MEQQLEVFSTKAAPAPREQKAPRRGPLMSRIEQHFRDHRYESITVQDLFITFSEDKLDTIRNAVRKLVKERTIKSTGMIRHSDSIPQPQPIGDVICLTLTLSK